MYAVIKCVRCEYAIQTNLQHASCTSILSEYVSDRYIIVWAWKVINHGEFVAVAHGTFIGSTRLEPQKPTQLPLDTTISFGASTRSYTLRERPQAIVSLMSEGEGEGGELGEGGALLGLPDLDNEVDVSYIQVQGFIQEFLLGQGTRNQHVEGSAGMPPPPENY